MVRQDNRVIWDADMADVDVPEFYSDTIGRLELAGDGNIRCWRCVTRANRIVPVYTVVTPVNDWITFPSTFTEVAKRIHKIRASVLHAN